MPNAYNSVQSGRNHSFLIERLHGGERGGGEGVEKYLAQRTSLAETVKVILEDGCHCCFNVNVFTFTNASLLGSVAVLSAECVYRTLGKHRMLR